MRPVRLRLRAIFELSFSLLLVFLCGLSASQAATRILTDSDKGAKVSLYDGDRLELRLTSNPSTGYEWSVHPQSTPLMKLINESKTQSKEPGVGLPIIQILRFEAVKRGDGVLLLHYVRSWDLPDPNEQQFDLYVSIH